MDKLLVVFSNINTVCDHEIMATKSEIFLEFQSFMHRNRIASFCISLGKLIIISWGNLDFKNCIFIFLYLYIIDNH